jgi:hypothetical protein
MFNAAIRKTTFTLAKCDTKLPAKTAQGSQGKFNSLDTLKMKQIDVQIE